MSDSCVISSFITKPQPVSNIKDIRSVALYPLSSPNHNARPTTHKRKVLRYILFHHQTTTSNQTPIMTWRLRYILFHHQTTTCSFDGSCQLCCVISSFITKPQLFGRRGCFWAVALYPLSSPNHNITCIIFLTLFVALYPLSSPNHNSNIRGNSRSAVALYPLSSPNHNCHQPILTLGKVALYPLSSPNHN